jgi:outer membrane protein TolC
LVAVLALAGCTSPRESVARRTAERDTAYRAAAVRNDDLAPARLTYTDALASLRANNLELRAARNSVISAEERARQVFKDLLPASNLSASVSRSVTDLANLSRADVAYAAYGFINVPGLVQFRLRYYAAQLELLRARWSCELKERELTLQLREAFLRAELLDTRRRTLHASLQWESAASPLDGFEADPRGIERESILYTLRTEADALQLALVQLTGDDRHLWKPDPADLPVLNYADNPPDFADTARYGQLFRQLQALDVEALSLRERGIKLQYWPDLRLSLSSPPLYQNTGGTTSSWDVDQVLFSANTSMPIDIQGNISRQLRETRRDHALQLARMADQLEITMQRLATSREALALTARRLRIADIRLQSLRTLPLTQSAERVRQNLDRLLRLDEQRTTLILERARLEHLFWILDETRWTRPDWDAPRAAQNDVVREHPAATSAPQS